MTAQPAPKTFLPALQRSTVSAFAPIQREFNRLFEELGAGWSAFADFELTPRVDFRDTKDGIELTVELPGIDQKDVKIDVEDDVLTISGEKKAEREDNYRIAERSYGSFSRSVVLPRSVDGDAIKAVMNDGVLKVTAPKKAGAEGKTIKIEAAH